jgi:hypothetical protein
MTHALEYRVLFEALQALDHSGDTEDVVARIERHAEDIIWTQTKEINSPRYVLFSDGSFAAIAGSGARTRITTHPALSYAHYARLPAGLVALLGQKLPSLQLMVKRARLDAEGTTQ